MEKIKLFSDKEKSNTETYLLKMVDEIKKLQIPLKWGRLGHHRSQRRVKLSFKQCKNCEFITEDTCILEEHELINHQRVEVNIHIQSNSSQAESESEAIVPLNIETSPPEGVGNTQQLSTRSLSPVDEDVIQSNAPQTEPEKEAIIPSNIETPLPEEVDNI